MEENSKKNLKKFGIFLGIAVFISALLIFTIILARDSWKNGFAEDIQKVLDEKYGEKYSVEDFAEIDSNLSVSVVFYTLESDESDGKEFAAVARLPSIVGSVPAVFLVSSDSAEFAGYALEMKNAQSVLNEHFSRGILSYWKKMLPKLTEKIKAEAK